MQLNSSRDLKTFVLVGLPVLSGLWLAIGVGVIGALTPDYSHISQFMSALGASNAPLAAWTNYIVFIPTELYLLAFLGALGVYLPCSKLKWPSIVVLAIYALLLIAASILPCDPGCHGDGDNLSGSSAHVAHMAIAAIAYPLALIGLLLLCQMASSASFLNRLALPVVALGFCLFAAIGLLPELQGLFQRLLETLIYVQLILFGRYVASVSD